MTIFWLRLKMTIVNSWWWSYLAKEYREKKELDRLYAEAEEKWTS